MTSVPHIVGYQRAGTIREVGEGVVDRKVGQRVVATLSSGSPAEVVAAPVSTTWVIPEGADVVAAACVPVACSCGIPLAAGWASVEPPTLWPGATTVAPATVAWAR
jgi:NADPH2:quinone reductase